MANEILYSGLGDQTVAAQLASFYHLLLADRESGVLLHPALIDAGVGQPGSLVMQVPQLGLMGYDLLVSGTEGTDPGNTALTDGNDQITLAGYEKIYEAGDLARMVDAFGVLQAETMAMDMAFSVAQTLIDALAALATGFSTNVVGTSGVDLVTADILDGITKLEVSKVSGRLCALLHPTQFGDLRTDALSLGGAVQQMSDPQGLVRAAGGLYRGSVYNVDFFASSQCDTSDAGANVNGIIFGRGALLHGRGAYVPEPGDANIIDLGIPGTPITARLERDRNGRAGLTAWIQRAVLGVIEGIDAAGCRVRSDA